MSANKVIIITVSVYVALFIIAVIYFLTMKVTGDAAGKGLATGYAFIFGTGILLLLGVTLVIIFLFFFGKVTVGWIKWLAFVPVILPLLVIAKEFVHFEKKLPPEEEQRHVVVIDLRSTSKLENLRIKFRSGSVTFMDKLELLDDSKDLYYYQHHGTIYYMHYAMFMLYNDNAWLGEVDLDIPEEPVVAPYSEWQTFPIDYGELKDSLQIEYRYKVTK